MFAQESVVDIKKEREAFVENYRKVYKVDKSLFVNDSGEFTDLFCQDAWVMWQAAKAQAVPEGFVLVPKEIPKSFDEGLYFYSNSISVVNEHSDGFIPMSDIDHSEIWKLVIEAQEQAND